MSVLEESPRAATRSQSELVNPRASADERAPEMLAAGGILAALGMAACCVAPFALFTLGVSGACENKTATVAFDDAATGLPALIAATTNAGYSSHLAN